MADSIQDSNSNRNARFAAPYYTLKHLQLPSTQSSDSVHALGLLHSPWRKRRPSRVSAFQPRRSSAL